MTDVLGGGGRESSVKHGAGGPTGGASTDGEGPGGGGQHGREGGARAEKDRRGRIDGCIMHRVHTSMKGKGLMHEGFFHVFWPLFMSRNYGKKKKPINV